MNKKIKGNVIKYGGVTIALSCVLSPIHSNADGTSIRIPDGTTGVVIDTQAHNPGFWDNIHDEDVPADREYNPDGSIKNPGTNNNSNTKNNGSGATKETAKQDTNTALSLRKLNKLVKEGQYIVRGNSNMMEIGNRPLVEIDVTELEESIKDKEGFIDEQNIVSLGKAGFRVYQATNGTYVLLKGNGKNYVVAYSDEITTTNFLPYLARNVNSDFSLEEALEETTLVVIPWFNKHARDVYRQTGEIVIIDELGINPYKNLPLLENGYVVDKKDAVENGSPDYPGTYLLESPVAQDIFNILTVLNTEGNIVSVTQLTNNMTGDNLVSDMTKLIKTNTPFDEKLGMYAFNGIPYAGLDNDTRTTINTTHKWATPFETLNVTISDVAHNPYLLNEVISTILVSSHFIPTETINSSSAEQESLFVNLSANEKVLVKE